jgi:HAD superfamily hydrolase (TIGR01549 family)
VTSPSSNSSNGASVDTVLFDLDGTLVDSNYQHTMAWLRAFGRRDLTPPAWRIHRALGMGGDRLVAAVAGDDVEEQHGDALREAWVEEYDPYLNDVHAFAGARDLLEELAERGCRVVLASSGKEHHVERYVELLDGHRLAQAWTSSSDAETTKPAPDLLVAALKKVDHQQPTTVGDSVWDVLAAREIGLDTHCVRSGGTASAELSEAGAASVHDDVAAMRKALDTVLR